MRELTHPYVRRDSFTDLPGFGLSTRPRFPSSADGSAAEDKFVSSVCGGCVCVCVCVCVCERERESVCVCVCVCV